MRERLKRYPYVKRPWLMLSKQMETLNYNFYSVSIIFPLALFSYLFLSFAKNVSGTQIFSAKSPDRVRTLFSSGLKERRSSFQYWFKYIVMV